MARDNFLKGAAILGLAGLIVKILGAFYRIPLSNMIGPEGMGYYQTAYPLYVLLVAVSTSGFPTAIAKIVSEKRALHDYRGAHRVFRISFMGFLAAGIITSLFVYFTAGYIVEAVGNSKAYYSLIAMTPALFFVPIMSAFRGYFQGRQSMTPTAISQFIEQLFRVSIGLFLAYQLVGIGLPQAAGGASFGASAGAIAGTIIIVIIYIKEKGKIIEEVKSSAASEQESVSKIVKDILIIAVPITIGASILPIISTIDTFLIMRRLQEIGFTQKEATALYGQLTGNAQTLINLPQVLSMAIAVSLVPAISSAFARKDFSEIRSTTKSGIRVTLLIGLPCAFGLFILSTPIIDLLYYNYSLAEKQSTGAILQILAISLIFLTLIQSLTAILQGLGKIMIPVKNLAIGAIVKTIFTYILTGIPSINVKGAAISTIMAYLVAAILNFIEVKKYTKVQFRFIDIALKPIISTLIMTAIVWVSYRYTSGILGSKISTVLSIGIGGIAYVIALLLSGALTSEDFELLPKGEKLAKKLKSKRLLKS
ncbi:polysaccharide biosynthesis protein [Proteiniborus sp. MB09-C3]|uniref:putative polysaccharide biosynthesis protein n=1 Tax=Proteiniborus sp. MB09-C3 TaxID=3050072 RepID=UPI00255776A2|nr:polysaccharide biosynthesis protein [Proteiniborus sp. MB09-C3]WIV13042.1 polysaccharide biosynthesis protein [Proteiniborus sp. MB09-C3]